MNEWIILFKMLRTFNKRSKAQNKQEGEKRKKQEPLHQGQNEVIAKDVSSLKMRTICQPRSLQRPVVLLEYVSRDHSGLVYSANIVDPIALIKPTEQKIVRTSREGQALIKKLSDTLQTRFLSDDPEMQHVYRIKHGDSRLERQKLGSQNPKKYVSTYTIDYAKLERKKAEILLRSKTAIKGHLGELSTATSRLYAGYVSLPCRLPCNHGIDHIFVKYDNKRKVEDLVVVESKYRRVGGSIKLSITSEGGQQLSNVWLNKQMDRLRDSGLHKPTLEVLENNKSKIQLQAYILSANGRQTWQDYGGYDPQEADKKRAQRVASCCPFRLELTAKTAERNQGEKP